MPRRMVFSVLLNFRITVTTQYDHYCEIQSLEYATYICRPEPPSGYVAGFTHFKLGQFHKKTTQAKWDSV